MNDYPDRPRQPSSPHCVVRGCRARPTRPGATAATTPPRPRDSVRGSDVCSHHAFRFAETLAEFIRDSMTGPGVYQLLERSLTKTTRLENTTVDTSGHTDVGTMWNPAAAQALADLNSWIRNLVAIINDDRPGGPHIQTPAHPLLQLEVIRRHHAQWLALYPTLGPDLIREISDLHRTALDAIDTNPIRRVILNGRGCAHLEYHPDFGDYYCGGQLFGIIRPPGDDGSRIVCSVSPDHTIERADWMDHAHG